LPKKITLDKDRIRALANMQASNEEIARICGMNRKTLERHLSQELQAWKAEGLEVIRFYQWKALKQGSVQMALRLGEIYLPEQREKPNNATQFTQIHVHRETLPEAEICGDAGVLEQIPSKDTSCEQTASDL
jgi:hypothetical protein